MKVIDLKRILDNYDNNLDIILCNHWSTLDMKSEYLIPSKVQFRKYFMNEWDEPEVLEKELGENATSLEMVNGEKAEIKKAILIS